MNKLIVLSLVSALVGCGGGSGGGDTVTNNYYTAPTPAPVVSSVSSVSSNDTVESSVSSVASSSVVSSVSSEEVNSSSVPAISSSVSSVSSTISSSVSSTPVVSSSSSVVSTTPVSSSSRSSVSSVSSSSSSVSSKDYSYKGRVDYIHPSEPDMDKAVQVKWNNPMQMGSSLILDKVTHVPLVEEELTFKPWNTDAAAHFNTRVLTNTSIEKPYHRPAGFIAYNQFGVVLNSTPLPDGDILGGKQLARFVHKFEKPFSVWHPNHDANYEDRGVWFDLNMQFAWHEINRGSNESRNPSIKVSVLFHMEGKQFQEKQTVEVVLMNTLGTKMYSQDPTYAPSSFVMDSNTEGAFISTQDSFKENITFNHYRFAGGFDHEAYRQLRHLHKVMAHSNAWGDPDFAEANEDLKISAFEVRVFIDPGSDSHVMAAVHFEDLSLYTD